MARGDQLLEALERRHLPWDATVGGLLAVLFLAVGSPLGRITHDMAMLLVIAQQQVHGAKPYVDWLETNPPWIHHLLSVPVRLAEASALPLADTYQLGVGVLVALGVLGARRVLLRDGSDPMFRGLILVALVIHAFAVLHAGDFGQKEHLWFLLSVPWVLALVLRDGYGDTPTDQAMYLTFGWAAALGAQIKPHFVAVGLVWLLGLGIWRGRRVWFSPAVIGYVLGGLLGYPLLLLSLPPESVTAIREFYLPVVLDSYARMSTPWTDVLGISALPFAAYITASIAALAGPSDRRFTLPVIALLALSAVQYLAQAKGFQYHRIPLLGFAALTAAGAVHAWHSSDRPVGLSAWMLSILAGVLLCGRALLASEPRIPLMEAIDPYAEPGDPVIVLDSALPPAWPGLLLEGYRSASRWYPSGMPVALAYAGQDPVVLRTLDQAEGMEALYFERLAARIEQDEPVVIAVSNYPGCKFCPDGLSILELIEHNGFRSGAMANYVAVEGAPGFTVFARK